MTVGECTSAVATVQAMASPVHVAVVAFPFSSHGPKLLALARALATAAPSATFSFVSTKDSLARVRSPVPANLKLVEASWAEWEKDTPWWRQIELFLDGAEAGGLRKAIDAAAAMAGGARVIRVVSDSFMSMAAHADVPWIAVWTGGPCALLAHIQGDAIRNDIGNEAAKRADELLTPYPGLGTFRVRDLPFADPSTGPITGGEMFRIMTRILRGTADRVPRCAATTALNSFPGLFPEDVAAALQNAIPNNPLPIGPYHLIPGAEPAVTDDPLGCLPWLSRRATATVAYVSFGTAVALEPNELRELALGLDAAGAPFLWSLRTEFWPLLPPGFVDRVASNDTGLVVPWTPQAAVLRHEAVGAFVTHSGWGAVLEALAGGVPMLCRPFFGDQMMNARAVELMWRFGRAFDDDTPMTRDAVEAAVKAILEGEEGASMRAKAREMRDMVAAAFEPDGGSMVNFRKFVDLVCAPAV